METITAALGLRVADCSRTAIIAAGGYPLRPLRRSDFHGAALGVVNVLYALEQVGEPWQLMLTCACPYCGGPGAWLRASNEQVDVDCDAGCDAHAFTQALLGHLNERGHA